MGDCQGGESRFSPLIFTKRGFSLIYAYRLSFVFKCAIETAEIIYVVRQNKKVARKDFLAFNRHFLEVMSWLLQRKY